MKTKLRERENMLISEVSKNQGDGGVGKPPIDFLIRVNNSLFYKNNVKNLYKKNE